jgi:DNA-binding MarR family transcriptional regulator
MVHANQPREDDLLALDRTIERMRRMVIRHMQQMPEGVPQLPFEVAALRAAEAVAELEAPGSAPTIKDLAEYHGVDHSTASRMVATAERQGLVERTTDAQDRRRVTLALTAPGRQAVEEMPFLRSRFLDAAMSDWTDSDVTAFRHLFERFRLCVDRAFASPAAQRGATSRR